LWLNGGAGVGKSIIAWLVTNSLPDGFLLGSQFYCRHNDKLKNSAARLVATIAYDLISVVPDIATDLKAAMDQDAEDVENNQVSLLDQPILAFDKLVLNPLSKITTPPSKAILIVIDALDECGKQGDSVRREFLEVLTR